MQFLLKARFGVGELELTEDEFDMVRKTYLTNQKLLALEEKYLLILQNYAELERSFHELALASLLFCHKDWSESLNDILLVNGKLLNLLSSTKAFLDQAPQHLNDIFGENSKESEKFVSATHVEFDSSFEYRILSAVRNQVQHSEFPVQLLQIGGQWQIDLGEKTLCRQKATAFINLAELALNPSIRKKTREELVGSGLDQIDLKALVRSYLSSMARLHEQIRQSVENKAIMSQTFVTSLIARFEQSGGGTSTGLHVISTCGAVQPVPVFTENIERRNYLVNHCRILTNFEKHCVSTES